MLDTPLIFRSARELAALIRSGEVSSVQVVEAHLSQIRRWNDTLHAVVHVREQEALREAEAADRMQREGRTLGPLHGVPMTLKDSLRVRGVRSTFGGLPPFMRHMPKSDSKMAARLRQAGAIFIGRTNLPLMALDWQCHNPFFPEGVNPWDFSRTPGGSSGGAAAAVAAGFSPLELGSDLGGSIRYPAHCCGILGLRTTDGLLPNDDIGPEGLATPFRQLLAFGPMGRDLGDLALMLDVLTDSPAPSAAFSASPVSPRLRIAVSTAFPGALPNAATRGRLDSLIAGLRADGHDVDCAAAPEIDLETAWRVWGTLAGYDLWSGTPPPFNNAATRYLFDAYMLRRNLGEGPFRKWFLGGMKATPREYEAARVQRQELLRTVDDFFSRYTLWILPVAMGEAIKTQPRGSDILEDGRSVPYSVYLGSYTVPTTAYGTPVLTAPIGFGERGMPIGVQIHGARHEDRQLLQTAEQVLSKYITVRPPTPLL